MAPNQNKLQVLVASMTPNLYKLIGFGGLHGSEPYKSTSFGCIHGPKLEKLTKGLVASIAPSHINLLVLVASTAPVPINL